MNHLKLIGALLIVASSTWVGLSSAHSLRRLQSALEGFTTSLERMREELSFSRTDFAALCATLRENGEKESARFFSALEKDVSGEDFQPIGATARAADAAGLRLPPAAFLALEQLFDGFGRLDLDGQIRQIDYALTVLRRQAEEIRSGADQKCRSYQLLGLCTGIAVMILVI